MNLALVLFTDGRWDYLQETLRSVNLHLSHVEWAQRIMVDDSGQDDPPPVDLDGWELVKHNPRKGLGAAVRAGWAALNDDIDFVWHQEDDFVFVDTPPVADMVAALQRHSIRPKLAQVALLRNAVNPSEKLQGGVFGMYPDRFHESDGMVWQKHLFTFNPSVYPRWVTKCVDVGMGLEQDVTDQLLEDDAVEFAYWGGLHDLPRVWHIGIRRSDGYHW